MTGRFRIRKLRAADLGQVDFALARSAVRTQVAVAVVDERLASEALRFLHRKGHDAALARGRRRLADRARVLANEERRAVLDDGLENALKRVLQLRGAKRGQK